jgi:hypothetical protein
MPFTAANLKGLDQTISNPYFALAQKLPPFKAIKI